MVDQDRLGTNVRRAHQRGAFFLQVARKVTAAGGKAYVFHWDYKGCSGAPETKTQRPSTVLSAVFWLENKTINLPRQAQDKTTVRYKDNIAFHYQTAVRS